MAFQPMQSFNPSMFGNVGHMQNADPMDIGVIQHCAEQAVLFARNNPMNPQAQQQAAWWAERLAAAQRHQMQMMMQQQQASMPMPAPAAPQAQAPPPAFGAGAPTATSLPGGTGPTEAQAVH